MPTIAENALNAWTHHAADYFLPDDHPHLHLGGSTRSGTVNVNFIVISTGSGRGNIDIYQNGTWDIDIKNMSDADLDEIVKFYAKPNRGQMASGLKTLRDNIAFDAEQGEAESTCDSIDPSMLT